MQTANPLGPNPFDVITLSPANPSAGADFSLDVNANTRWQVTFVGFRLITDANSGTRIIGVHGFDGTDIIYRAMSSATMSVSANSQFHFNVGIGRSTTGGSAADQIISLNAHLILNIGDSIRITVTNIQVGDQISDIRIRVHQWITEN